ncbi:MAG: polynucleotide phosphorylase, partial [Candidatus Synechococcus spongiarum 142]
MQGEIRSFSFDGREVQLTINRFAPQAGGSVMLECGGTVVLVTVTRSAAREGVDFLPLLCDYEERMYAAGRIPGSYQRREGRPPERAILTCRLMDRPLRPLFPSWLRDDIQVVATCQALDERMPPDVLAVTGSSMATLLARLPFAGPMAAVRVGLLGDDFIINPSFREIERSDLDLVVAGTPHGVVMIEAGAKQLPEHDVIEAIDFGYEAVQDLIKHQQDILTSLDIGPVHVEPETTDDVVLNYLEAQCSDSIRTVLAEFDLSKADRDNKLSVIKSHVASGILNLNEDHPVRMAVASNIKLFGTSYKALTKKLMRGQILTEGKRVDGRGLDQVRSI